MGMSEFYGLTDDTTSLEVLTRALDLGVTFFDTADTYGFGHNEELLGKGLRSRTDVVVATKCAIVRERGRYERRLDTSPAYIKSSCEASLKRLGRETIDLYYLHRIDGVTPIEESVGALAELIDAGKIRAYGLCEVSGDTLRRAHRVHPVSALQMEYSLWTRDAEAEILPSCRELDVTFVAYSPLGRGFLSGAIDKPGDFEAGDFRAANPRFQKENLTKNLELLNSVKAIASRHGCMPGQVALAWLLAQGKDIVPIPGTKRVPYLEENVAAASVNLGEDDLAHLRSAFAHVAGERYTPEGMKGVNA
ncbi:MAG: aldo/keto reductase [Rhizobiaceae bacterium]|nr:aldo/keto reductase [Rhizobiaceae bacterium]